MLLTSYCRSILVRASIHNPPQGDSLPGWSILSALEMHARHLARSHCERRQIQSAAWAQAIAADLTTECVAAAPFLCLAFAALPLQPVEDAAKEAPLHMQMQSSSCLPEPSAAMLVANVVNQASHRWLRSLQRQGSSSLRKAPSTQLHLEDPSRAALLEPQKAALKALKRMEPVNQAPPQPACILLSVPRPQSFLPVLQGRLSESCRAAQMLPVRPLLARTCLQQVT